MTTFETPNQGKRKADVAISPLDHPSKQPVLQFDPNMPENDDVPNVSAEIIAYIDLAVTRAIAATKQEYEAKIIAITSENTSLQRRVLSLEQRVGQLELANDALEQYSRRNSVRISGLDTDSDDPEDLESKVISLVKKGNVTINTQDIDRVHKVGQKDDILVKFTTYKAKASVMNKKKEINAKENDVYIGEDLTHLRSTLLYEARQIRKAGLVKHVWTSDGKIIVRDNTDKKRKVFSLRDLNQYR